MTIVRRQSFRGNVRICAQRSVTVRGALRVQTDTVSWASRRPFAAARDERDALRVTA